jgi:hypothetical protein
MPTERARTNPHRCLRATDANPSLWCSGAHYRARKVTGTVTWRRLPLAQ